RGQPPATSANYVGLTATVAAHELGHLLGLRHSDAFGPLGVNPATGLPYGIYSGLLSKEVTRNETLTSPGGSGQPGPITLSYVLKHAPILLGPIALTGSPTAVHTISGTVSAGTLQVATFSVGPDGRLALTPAPNLTPSARTVLAGFLNLA